MVIQVLDLSLSEVFERYRLLYNIPGYKYFNGLLALEITKAVPGIIDEAAISDFNNIYCIPENDSQLNLLLIGPVKDFQDQVNKYFPGELFQNSIYSALNNYLQYDEINYQIANRDFVNSEIQIMGIINVTPDSFSDGGKYCDHDNAILRAEEMILEGADIIDIGGESTRPGSEFISVQKEINRIIPVIKKIKEKYPETIISADTTKSEVALKALEAGAQIINDISGATFDEKIPDIVKEFDAAIVLMHIKGVPKIMQENPTYNNLINEVYDFLWNQSLYAKGIGIRNIFVDPGIGFGKTISHNLELIKRLSDFKSLGFPIMFGSSRKSFLGKIAGLDVSQRDVISTICDSFAVKSGARIIRTHNVKHGVQLKKFYKALNNNV